MKGKVKCTCFAQYVSKSHNRILDESEFQELLKYIVNKCDVLREYQLENPSRFLLHYEILPGKGYFSLLIKKNKYPLFILLVARFALEYRVGRTAVKTKEKDILFPIAKYVYTLIIK